MSGFEKPVTMTYDGDRQLAPRSVRLGVTEITLGDGRIIRAWLHVKSVKADALEPENVDVSYFVVSEIVDCMDRLMSDAHTTVQ